MPFIALRRYGPLAIGWAYPTMRTVSASRVDEERPLSAFALPLSAFSLADADEYALRGGAGGAFEANCTDRSYSSPLVLAVQAARLARSMWIEPATAEVDDVAHCTCFHHRR